MNWSDLNVALEIALEAAQNFKGKIKPTNLALMSIFAGLSALGALWGRAAGTDKAVNDARSANYQLEEAQSHNKTMEGIALSKEMYLRPN